MMIFLADNIIEQFNADKSLLLFISKNLSWGIFKQELISSGDDSDVDFYNIYKILENSPIHYKYFPIPPCSTTSFPNRVIACAGHSLIQR